MFGVRPNMSRERYHKWWYTTYGGYKLVGLTWKNGQVVEEWERLPSEAWQGAPDDMPMDLGLPKGNDDDDDVKKKPGVHQKKPEGKTKDKKDKKPGAKSSASKPKGGKAKGK